MVAIAFMMPLEPKLVTGPIILLSFASLLLIKEWRPQHFKSLSVWLQFSLLCLAAFFLLHIIGQLWTEHLDEGWKDIGRKLNLLILPLLILVLSLDERAIIRVLKAFILGVFFSVILNMGQSTLDYMDRHESIVFMGEYAIHYLHLGYYAIYLLFSMSIILDFLLSGSLGRKSWNKGLYIFIGLSSIPILVFSGSKMGFLTLIALIGLMLIFLLRGRSLKRVILLPMLVIGMLIGAVLGTEHLSYRLHTMYETTFNSPIVPDDTESTMARRMTWNASSDLWSENAMLGVGTGDVQAELMAEYEEKGFNGPYSKSLDPHSQYLQSAAALGILGFMFLLFSMLIPFIISARKGYFTQSAFFLVMLLACLTESVLERQAGIQFYAFFAPILLIWMDQRDKNNATTKDILNLWPF